ncbi:hypothetical protein FLM03_03890 [Vibrio cholerae]|nr:hypothetical protein FLM03_03890 [Vibrio cholerae]TQP25533.1 hypothetical protein FLL94_09990 [Vibrio cholerae]
MSSNLIRIITIFRSKSFFICIRATDHISLLHFDFEKAHNARLRGWQRITTKLKHNNRNHRGSMGLETPRVDSPA